MKLPRLYAIVDRIPGTPFFETIQFVEALLAGGVTLLQYRNKKGEAPEMLAEARELKRIAARHVKQDVIQIIMNDRADLCMAAGLDGVHVGQDDMSPSAARTLCKEPMIVGVSTHNLSQLEVANESPADYIAFGPVFSTTSKETPDPVVGIHGLREARGKTKKPLVAIGGITLENCREVIDAGADSVAIISALAGRPKHAAEEFLRRMT